MPIRTPRGRSAAYRVLWQWPLRSPARLVLCLALLVAVVAGAVTGIGTLRGARAVGSVTTPTASQYPDAAPTGLPATIAPTVLPPVAALTPSSRPLGAAPSTALSVAQLWVTAWADHPRGVTSQQWVDGLRPFTTDEYLGVLTGVDPANVPASRVTGAPRAVRVAARSLQVDVPTDALTLRVLVVDTDDGWRVAGYDRV